MNVWIVGCIVPDEPGVWNFLGVFTHETDAVDACESCLEFVAPCPLNDVIPDNWTHWMGQYFPLSETRPDDEIARSTGRLFA